MKHFSIQELTHSSTACARNIDNTPPTPALESLCRLVHQVLDPLREAFGAPITVNSGYRSSRLNRAVGGAPRSQHTRGEAADITAGSPEANRRLFDLAIALDLPFDQLIDEHGYRWIHISSVAGANRKAVYHM